MIRSAAQTRLGQLGNKTYNDLLPYKSHPFLQFTNDPSLQVAVLNFSMSYWTSAHSLVNLVLNVVDFAPDYIVIHHAWNDAKYRNAGVGFRGDYSHILRTFERPSFVIDRYLIRTSVLYRYLKFKLNPPDWTFLDNALSVRQAPVTKVDDSDGLRTYRRNIETMIDVALTKNIMPILTTMPHTLDARKPAGMTLERADDIDACNQILRRIAETYGDRISFLDLDKMMTGKMESVFKDTAHVTEAGREFKAQVIGTQVLWHIRGGVTSGRGIQ